MANNFKKYASQQRAAVPQVDPEGMKAVIPMPVHVDAPQVPLEPAAPVPVEPPDKITQTQPSAANTHHITIVDSNEAPVNRGFFMYPSRHRQIAKDLAYIEDRKPWQIIENALEEYVIKHYGKEYKRK